MPGGSKYEGPSEALEAYGSVVEASRSGAEVKGAKNPYTSRNGHMFSFLDAGGTMALRLSDELTEQFRVELRERRRHPVRRHDARLLIGPSCVARRRRNARRLVRPVVGMDRHASRQAHQEEEVATTDSASPRTRRATRRCKCRRLVECGRQRFRTFIGAEHLCGWLSDALRTPRRSAGNDVGRQTTARLHGHGECRRSRKPRCGCELEVCCHHRQQQRAFEKGEVVADAEVGTSAERRIGVPMAAWRSAPA